MFCFHEFNFLLVDLFSGFRQIFDPQVSVKTSLSKFQQIFLTKSAKQQIASVSLTVQDRAISSKFLKHTVSKITTLPKNHFSFILALF